MNGVDEIVVGAEVYWVYLTYAVGVMALLMVGYRKWQGWIAFACVHLVFVVTGFFINLPWLVVGNASYLVVDLIMAYVWYHRAQREARASASFVQLVKKQFVDGKRQAIYELLRLERDIDELTGRGRNRENQLIDWLRDEANKLEAVQDTRGTPGSGAVDNGGHTRVEVE